jgi:hypothetical protein
MSPHFLKLCKGVKSKGDLSDICNPDGTTFNSMQEREDYIVNYYEEIYKVPEGAPVNFDNLIETFLGPDICAHPVVTGSKLSSAEADRLNDDLSLQELYIAAQDCDIRTDAGADGISNAFVKKFWKFFRKPLLGSANACFRKKELTTNFRTASIRLIPKKGDHSQIKNWRPISLLSCFIK